MKDQDKTKKQLIDELGELRQRIAELETAETERIRERMRTIHQQAKRATDLIQQILDFSRRTVLEPRPLDLVSFLEEQIQLLKRTLPENITIRLDYGIDEYIVHADPTRIQQMVMNLALNARDAMPEGGGTTCWPGAGGSRASQISALAGDGCG